MILFSEITDPSENQKWHTARWNVSESYMEKKKMKELKCRKYEENVIDCKVVFATLERNMKNLVWQKSHTICIIECQVPEEVILRHSTQTN